MSAGIDSVAYNGIPAGASMAMVDLLMGVGSAITITDTSGGRAREDDDAYRERIRLAPSHFAATGTADAYLYHARSATTLVKDASVRQSAPGEVEIAVLVSQDAPDAAGVVLEVQDYVSDPIRRTLTDLVTVREADAVPYTIELTYYANPLLLAEVMRAVEGAGGAIDQYIEWQDWTIGRDINPDKLRALMLAAGAERIDLVMPGYTDVDAMQRAMNTGLTISREPMPERMGPQ
jgi:phage-related baseplate assembly protein